MWIQRDKKKRKLLKTAPHGIPHGAKVRPQSEQDASPKAPWVTQALPQGPQVAKITTKVSAGTKMKPISMQSSTKKAYERREKLAVSENRMPCKHAATDLASC